MIFVKIFHLPTAAAAAVVALAGRRPQEADLSPSAGTSTNSQLVRALRSYGIKTINLHFWQENDASDNYEQCSASIDNEITLSDAVWWHWEFITQCILSGWLSLNGE